MLENYGEQLKGKLKKKEVNQLQGIVALFLDLGLIGVFFFMFLIIITLKNIARSGYPLINKYFYGSMIFINIFCLFIGYPMVMLPYILMLLPKGILFPIK